MTEHIGNSSTPRTIALVGAGSIGGGWAIVFASAGLSVRLYDATPQRCVETLGEIEFRLGELRTAGLLDESPDVVMARIEVRDSLAEVVDGADFVQENVSESVDVKREIFTQLDALAPRGVVLASSTSMIPCSRFASDLPGRDRCLVIHPGNPPYLLRVAELVPAEFTSTETVERAAALMTAVGTTPVIVRSEVEGFAFNRLQGALLREAYFLVGNGVVTAGEVDTLVRDGLGRRWSVTGPFATAELNTRGGIDRHAEVLGAAYARMGVERGADDPWTAETLARVSKAVHEVLPPELWAEHVRRRELAMIKLEGLRRRADIPEVAIAPEDRARLGAPVPAAD